MVDGQRRDESNRFASDFELQRLIERTARGDEAAFVRFRECMLPQTEALVGSILNGTAHIEDAIEDTFLRAWRHAASFDSREGSVRRWLFSIARNCAIQARRNALTP